MVGIIERQAPFGLWRQSKRLTAGGGVGVSVPVYKLLISTRITFFRLYFLSPSQKTSMPHMPNLIWFIAVNFIKKKNPFNHHRKPRGQNIYHILVSNSAKSFFLKNKSIKTNVHPSSWLEHRSKCFHLRCNFKSVFYTAVTSNTLMVLLQLATSGIHFTVLLDKSHMF